jgi:hypothetical protein
MTCLSQLEDKLTPASLKPELTTASAHSLIKESEIDPWKWFQEDQDKEGKEKPLLRLETIDRSERRIRYEKLLFSILYYK